MELKNLRNYIKNLGMVKYALLLAAVGIGLLLLPDGNSQPEVVQASAIAEVPENVGIERRIEEILSQVEGAGVVRVMLAEKNNGATEYQTDTQMLHDGDREEKRAETVFDHDTALVVRRTMPEYLGAVVVCQGGDSPGVRLRIVDAMCSLTGLSSDKITVLKMND